LVASELVAKLTVIRKVQFCGASDSNGVVPLPSQIALKLSRCSVLAELVTNQWAHVSDSVTELGAEQTVGRDRRGLPITGETYFCACAEILGHPADDDVVAESALVVFPLDEVSAKPE